MVLAVAGCRSHAPAQVAPPPPAPTDAAAGSADVDASVPDASAPAVALSTEQCRAFTDAGAIGIAVVASRTPDCSSVGHNRIVLDVQRLGRGQDIATLVTSRPLYGAARNELAVGDIVVVAIEPVVRPAETLMCVPLPAHQGTVRLALEAASLADAERILADITSGRACTP